MREPDRLGRTLYASPIMGIQRVVISPPGIYNFRQMAVVGWVQSPQRGRDVGHRTVFDVRTVRLGSSRGGNSQTTSEPDIDIPHVALT